VPGRRGTWKDLTDNVKRAGSQTDAQVRNCIAEVTHRGWWRAGDLITRKITVDVKGEILEMIKNTSTTMGDQLNAFAGKWMRAWRARRQGGQARGQAQVPGVDRYRKDLTDTVNFMDGQPDRAVPRHRQGGDGGSPTGDLKQNPGRKIEGRRSQRLPSHSKHDDTMATFADQVRAIATRSGRRRPPAARTNVHGAAGTWKDF